MKLKNHHRMVYVNKSLPVRGAWIEIYAGDIQEAEDASLPVRGAWIEIDAMDELAAYGTRRSP